MQHFEGIYRDYLTMFSDVFDIAIQPDARYTLFTVLVGRLDLSSLDFQRITTANTGRPPCHHGDLLHPYVCGYLTRFCREVSRCEVEWARAID